MPIVELVAKWPTRVVAWVALGGVVLAFGFVPLLHPGFVRQDIYASKITEQDQHQALDDQKEIFDLKEKECDLPKGGKDPKDIYRDSILSLAGEYQRLESRQPVIPACEDL